MIGCGKLGLPCAEVMAKHYDVVGYDVVKDPLAEIPLMDNIEDAIKDRDLIFVAVPTPHDPVYGGSTPITDLPSKDFDYSIVQQVLREINPFVNKSQLVVLISTVLPGTVRNHLEPLITNARFIYNPYLIAMGSVKWDMVNPECLIIGTSDGSTTGDAKLLVDFYKPIMENNPRVNIGTWDEAEAIKIFYNCYSEDTEVLTSTGWKLFSEATPDDKVLALNPDTMVPEWLLPDKWVSRDWSGEMIHFHSSKDDVLVTPGHNMFTGKQIAFRESIDGKTYGYSWELTPAENLEERSGFVFQRSTEWHNNSPDSILLAGQRIPTDIYVQFMAWYLSEGCNNSGRVIISQNRDINPDKYEMINDVFSVIHNLYPGKNKLCEGKTGISLLWEELANELSVYGKSFDKFVPDTIKNLGKDMIRLFLDTYNLADGSATHTTRFDGSRSIDRRYKYYATSSDQMAADLGELIIKVGRFPSYRTTETELSNKPCHLIYELVGKTSNYQKSSTVGLKFNKVNYSGKVHCAVLPKYHVFLTRRNGKCTWQGNTFISAKIGLVNMIQDVAEKNGNINVDVVTDALKAATQRITGPRYLTAGMGDSGACHPRDNIALRYLAEKLDLGYDLFHAIMHSRDMQAKNMALKLANLARKNNLNVVIHGRAYKPYVPYTIGSYSELIGHFLEKANVIFEYVDPLTDDKRSSNDPAVFLMAHSPEVTYFGTGVEVSDNNLYCDIPMGSIVLDPWRKFPQKEGIKVIHYGNTRKT